MMTGEAYRESLRALSPRVFLDGALVDSVVDAPGLAPGVNAVAASYDLLSDPHWRPLMWATDPDTGKPVDRMLTIDRNADDLLKKLEAVRLMCRQVGCAQRYLAHDAISGIWQATVRADAEEGGERHDRFRTWLAGVQAGGLSLGIAMTDAKGDRSLRPHEQPVQDAYVHVHARRPGGIVLKGVKAIITGGPYMHELLVMPGRAMRAEDAEFAVCCAVPVDAPGLTMVSRPAGRPGDPSAKFSAKYGQCVAVAIFDEVFVPWDRVFMDRDWGHAHHLATTYAAHHRHSCIAARAGFGDLLIGAGATMIEANGLDPAGMPHIRDAMVELITIVESFYACGVAASTFAAFDGTGVAQPDAVYSNVGKLLLATKIYDMHRLAHHVSGGLVVALPGPAEDHNPAVSGTLDAVFAGRADVPVDTRRNVARLMEDLTASYTAGWFSVISLHGGGSPEAMKREIWRHYPVEDRKTLVEDLIDRGVAGPDAAKDRQPGRCCVSGCQIPPAQIEARPGAEAPPETTPESKHETV